MAATLIDSILNSIKDAVGVEETETAFDAQLLMHTNSVFFTLYQLGIGPKTPFRIEDDSSTWSDFDAIEDVELVRSYVELKVRLLFDPPATATMYDAFDKQCKELEWRLTIVSDEENQNGS